MGRAGYRCTPWNRSFPGSVDDGDGGDEAGHDGEAHTALPHQETGEPQLEAGEEDGETLFHPQPFCTSDMCWPTTLQHPMQH